MAAKDDTSHDNLTRAVEAIGNLLLQKLQRIFSGGWGIALRAHSEIQSALISQKSGVFHRHYLPLLKALVPILGESYRQYFKLALAHPRRTHNDPHVWAWEQLQPSVLASLEWIRDWYILACDGENRFVRLEVSGEFAPGQTVSLPIPATLAPLPPPESWRAPAWLFQISLAFFGIGALKEVHIPARDSEEKLGAAHARLLFKGTRRVFLWDLEAVTKTVQNEELAAAGAIPEISVAGINQARRPNKRNGWEQRIKLYRIIRSILDRNPELQGIEFCAELDKYHALPLYDWTKRGEWRSGLTWKEAWSDSGLKSKIRRVRQEAMKKR
jgi:hypothetical protein